MEKQGKKTDRKKDLSPWRWRLVLGLALLLALSGCEYLQPYKDPSELEESDEETEELSEDEIAAENAASTENTTSTEKELADSANQDYQELLQDEYMVMDWSDGEERVILKSLTTGRQYRFAFGMATKFLDKWGNVTSQTNFSKGSVVSLSGVQDNMLATISLSKDAWVIEGLRNFSFNIKKETFQVGETKYRLKPDVSVFSDDRSITMDEVSTDDRLRVVGKGKTILSITVETGHGYISLQNTEFFNGSIVSIGTKIHAMLNGDTTVSVPQGKYRITVAKNGYGGSTKVQVRKDQTTYVDLSTLIGEGPKKCQLHFVASVKGVKAFLDGEKSKVNKDVEVDYGEHKLRVEVPGFQPWTKSLIVNSPSARISIDPTAESIPLPVSVTASDNSNSKKQKSNNASGSDGDGANASDSAQSNTSGQNATNNTTSSQTTQNQTGGSTTGGTTTNNTQTTSSNTGQTGQTTGGSLTGGSATTNTTNTGQTYNTNAQNTSEDSASGTDRYAGGGYGGSTTNSGSDYGAQAGGNNTNAATQRELDYLDTLSNMIDELTGE
ncbi:MAG: PEGA domain-containing protein [Lachnospiraceae bacterium]|nr:PEGA domain-containing protein [Lachnospiraceae bacterium]